MRSTIRCCSSCLTLLASPDSAGGGFGRVRLVSPRGLLLQQCICFCKIIVPISSVYSYVQVRMYQSGSTMHIRTRN